MAEFKLNISNPKTGKTKQVDLKDAAAEPLIGKKLKSAVQGNTIGFKDYEFEITGASDNCGFPLRSGILENRKKILVQKSVGFRGDDPGIYKRKTVCGSTINSSTVQINLKITKEGKEPIGEQQTS